MCPASCAASRAEAGAAFFDSPENYSEAGVGNYAGHAIASPEGHVGGYTRDLEDLARRPESRGNLWQRIRQRGKRR